MTAQVKHPQLGQIQGRQADGVIQFLGIKYASLKDRFSASELAKYDGGHNSIEATELG